MTGDIRTMSGALPERAEPEETFVDRGINKHVDGFVNALDADDRRLFNEHFLTLGDRVGEVCRQLGLQSYPAISPKAVNLRSMHVVRYLEGVATRNHGESERDYKLPVLDEFWSSVDRTTERYYGKLAAEKYNVELTPVDRSLEAIEAKPSQELGRLPGYTLLREVMASGGMPYQVLYVARLAEQPATVAETA